MNNHNIKLYGVSGVARAGKDTFAESLVRIISDETESNCQIISFADALKSDIDSFLLDRVGISAFTQDTDEKIIIRPLLVAYGMTMRTLDSLYWVNKVATMIQHNIENNVVSLITDVRFPNEVDFIKNYTEDVCVIHLKRICPRGEIIPPANLEEKENDPVCANLSHVNLTWPTFGPDTEEYDSYIKSNFWL